MNLAQIEMHLANRTATSHDEIVVTRTHPYHKDDGLTIGDLETGDSVWVPARCVEHLVEAIENAVQSENGWPTRIPR